MYRPFLLPSVHPLSVEGLTERKEVEQHQRQSRKSETDAVVPHLAALRAEAHYRYNSLLRLRQAYLQAVAAIQKESLPLPFHFSYDEGDPPVEQWERWLAQEDEALAWRIRAEAAEARLKKE